MVTWIMLCRATSVTVSLGPLYKKKLHCNGTRQVTITSLKFWMSVSLIKCHVRKCPNISESIFNSSKVSQSHNHLIVTLFQAYAILHYKVLEKVRYWRKERGYVPVIKLILIIHGLWLSEFEKVIVIKS